MGRALVQLATFVVLARVMSLAQFGVYSGLAALASVLVPLAMLGQDLALIKLFDGGRAGRRQIVHAVVLSMTLAALAGSAMAGVARGMAPGLVTLTVVAFLVVDSLLTIVGQHTYRQLVAHGRPVWGAVALNVPALVKLGWALSIIGAGNRSLAELDRWLLTYAALSAWFVIGFVVVLVATAPLARPASDSSLGRQIRTGWTFASALAVRALSVEAPRLVLGVTAAPTHLAVFSAAGRVAQVGMLPTQAFLGNRVSRMFTPGFLGEGATEMRRRVRRIGVLSGLVTAAGACAAPWVLGAEYQRAVLAGLVLSLGVPVQALMTFELDVLTALGGNKARFALNGLALVSAVVLCAAGWAVAGVVGTAVGAVLSHLVTWFAAQRTRRRYFDA